MNQQATLRPPCRLPGARAKTTAAQGHRRTAAARAGSALRVADVPATQAAAMPPPPAASRRRRPISRRLTPLAATTQPNGELIRPPTLLLPDRY
jgi:hypothetical protein